jgi:hypothetical protein
MDVKQLFQDYHIHFITGGNKHCTAGWINLHCPLCPGSKDYHLGFPLKGNWFRCWRCGWHPPDKVIAKLLHIDPDQAQQIVDKYGGHSPSTPNKELKPRLKSHRLPSNIGPLTERHKQYLAKRGFDPDYLEEEWGLLGTGPISRLDGISYKHRIVAPINWDGKQVSFQARDITGKALAKYLACPKARELVHHQHILYGKQEKWGDVGICVEGITDVWRLRSKAFAVFGLEYTNQQVRQMVKVFRKICVLFDNDTGPQGLVKARELVKVLKFRGVKSWMKVIQGDPGEMDQDDADALVREIISYSDSEKNPLLRRGHRL